MKKTVIPSKDHRPTTVNRYATPPEINIAAVNRISQEIPSHESVNMAPEGKRLTPEGKTIMERMKERRKPGSQTEGKTSRIELLKNSCVIL